MCVFACVKATSFSIRRVVSRVAVCARARRGGVRPPASRATHTLERLDARGSSSGLRDRPREACCPVILSMVKVVFLGFGAVKSGKRCLLHTNFSPFDYD